MNTTIIIGVASGIAAFKVVDLVTLLRKKGIEVCVIMTDHATQMVSPDLFIKASRNKVYANLFEKGFDYKQVLDKKEVEHIKIAKTADIFVLAPATANIIGKLANGIADDFLTTTILATTKPILLCPSMNTSMWQNEAVQENLAKLQKRGFYVLIPDSGWLACGMKGVGRLANIASIAKKIFTILTTREKLKGKKIMVTSGGTSEYIDAVRILTNRSSGKMGVALANECYQRGADVFLLRSITSVASPYPIREITFETAQELSDLIKKKIKDREIMFHVAAVSDFIPEKLTNAKVDSNKSLILKLNPTAKILHQIKNWNPKVKLIGFKAVYRVSQEDLIKIGIDKLRTSNSDYIIVNDVGREGIGFAADDNEVYIISKKGLVAKVSKAPKREVARKIIDYVFG